MQIIPSNVPPKEKVRNCGKVPQRHQDTIESLQAMESLLRLPSELLQHEIFHFFTAVDIAHLDVAVTNRSLRPLLFEVYFALPLRHKKQGLTLAQMVWFFRRSIPLKSIDFDATLSPSEMLDIFEIMESEGSNAAKVQHITLSPCSDQSGGMVCFQLLALCTGLISLTLHDCKEITPPVLHKLRHLNNTHLSTLDLSACTEITDGFVAALAEGCPSLTSLNLSHSALISDVSLTALSNCSLLNHLSLRGCTQLSSEAIERLVSDTSSLATLDLSWCCRVEDAAIVALSHSCQRSLTHLNVSNCSRITDAAVLSIALTCPGLTALDLSLCSRLTDVAVITLSHSSPSLTSLALARCELLTDAALFSLKRLTNLSLSRLSVSDEGVASLAQRCPLLTSLDASMCGLLTDSAVTALSVCCPCITSLDLSDCLLLTPTVLETAIFPALTSISLSGCELMTDEAVSSLAQHSSFLVDITLCRCPHITTQVLTSLAQYCSSLTALDLAGCGGGDSHFAGGNSLCQLSHETLKYLTSSLPLLTHLTLEGDGY